MRAKKRITTLFVTCIAALALVALCTGCASQNYKPEQKASSVDSSALVTPGTLTVGINSSNPPMAGQASTYVGIDVDAAAALADELGLKLSVVDVKTDAVDAIKNKKVDLVFGLDEESTKDKNVWLSDAYMQTGIAIFSPSSTATAPTASESTTFSAQASSVSAWTISNQFGSNRVKTTADLATALSNATNGTTNFAVADAVVGLYASHSSGYNLSIIALATPATNYCVGALNTNTSLQKSVSTALKSLVNNGTIGVIQKKWLGTSLQLSNLTVTANTTGTGNTTSNTATNTNSNTTNTASTTNATNTSNATNTTNTTNAANNTNTTNTTNTNNANTNSTN